MKIATHHINSKTRAQRATRRRIAGGRSGAASRLGSALTHETKNVISAKAAPRCQIIRLLPGQILRKRAPPQPLPSRNEVDKYKAVRRIKGLPYLPAAQSPPAQFEGSRSGITRIRLTYGTGIMKASNH